MFASVTRRSNIIVLVPNIGQQTECLVNVEVSCKCCRTERAARETGWGGGGGAAAGYVYLRSGHCSHMHTYMVCRLESCATEGQSIVLTARVNYVVSDY